MKLGFIGTGKISSSVITGICGSSIKYSKIYISSRNSKIAKSLKKKFKRILIEKDNQKIVDNCNWVFLAVTPTVGERIYSFTCLLYTSPSPRDATLSRMPSSA